MNQNGAIPTVLIGDFNINVLLPENNAIIGRIEKTTGLKVQEWDFRTKHAAQLNLVFSNKNLNFVTHFIPWSPHFGICCTVLTSQD